MRCGICGCEIVGAQAVSCTGCGAPFHEDCWLFNGRCGIYGCGAVEYGVFEPAEAGAVVAIDEATAPPLRIEPYVEGLLRRLPRWGRRLSLPLAFSLVGGLLVALLARLTFSFGLTLQDELRLLAASLVTGVLATVLGRTMRAAPFATAAAGFLVAGVAPWTPYVPGSLRFFVLMASGAVGASSLAEGLLGRFRGRGRFLPAILRCVASVVLFTAFFAGFALIETGRLRLLDLSQIATVSIFALVAAAPAFEVSKAALLHRLEAEAARREIEDRKRALAP